MTDIVDQLRNIECDREPFTAEHVKCICRVSNAAADEIERLRREVRVERDIVGLLRAQLRVLGHIPMVVETEAIGQQELAMRRGTVGN